MTWRGYSMDGVELGVGPGWTLNVTAGQTYIVALASDSGIGHYDLTFDLVPSVVDWGAIVDEHFSNVALTASDNWFQFTATHDGWVTVGAQRSASLGDIVLRVYDEHQQLLGTAAASTHDVRLDVEAKANDIFYVHASSANTLVDFRLTNLVAWSGHAAIVHGTDFDDVFSVKSGPDASVTVNGIEYHLGSSISSVHLDGAAGNDTITIYGTSADESVIVRAGSAKLMNGGFSGHAEGLEHIVVHGGGGSDVAQLADSHGDDRFVGRPDSAVMKGAGYSNRVLGFDRVLATASGGSDRAFFFDSEADDRFVARPGQTVMKGGGVFRQALGFDYVYAYADGRGLDRAFFFDSQADDHLDSRATTSILRGGGLYHRAQGFEYVYATANAGGQDRADLQDTGAADRFVAHATHSTMVGGGIYRRFTGFESVYAYAAGGETDRAFFYDSAAVDRFILRSDSAAMKGKSYYNYARGFAEVRGFSSAGGMDRAFLFDSEDDDLLIVGSRQTKMIAGESLKLAEGFPLTRSYTTNGGHDVAIVEGLVTGDSFTRHGDIGMAYFSSSQQRLDGFDIIVSDFADRREASGNQAVDLLFEQVGEE